MVRRLCSLIALSLFAVSCTQLDIDLESAQPTTTSPRAESGGGGFAPDTPTNPDDLVDAALVDILDFWERTYPTVHGEDFDDIGGFHPYEPGVSVPDCGDETLTYDVIKANAFYCPDSDYIAWDRVGLIPDLLEDFGPLTVGIVMAHEVGHAVQDRAGTNRQTIILELQADCFAGAWVADVGEGNAASFSLNNGGLDQAIAGFLALRDNVGVGSRNPNAHGSGFDRINAFQDGFLSGALTCDDYNREPPEIFARAFRRVDDFERGGNLPTIDLLGPLLGDVERFFDDAFATLGRRWDPVDRVRFFDASQTTPCGDQDLTDAPLSFYCVPDDQIFIDEPVLLPALEEIGDFAVAGEIVRQYALAAQVRLGISDDNDRTDAHADCIVGSYTAAQFAVEIPEQILTLSPGDVDEVIIAFLATADDENIAGVFDRVTAFRAGFSDGFGSCAAFLTS